MPSQLEGQQPELLATPCVTCREHHLKCDRTIPRCGRCARAGRDCKLAFKFKSSKDSFKKSQKWLRAPTRLTYVDETRSLITGSPLDDVSNLNHSVHEGDESSGSTCSQHHKPANLSDASASATVSVSASISDRQAKSPRKRGRGDGGSSPNNATSPDVILPDPPNPHAHSLHTAVPARPYSLLLEASPDLPLDGHLVGPVYQGMSGLPLRNRTEAILFRHYIEKIATCLDCCDPLRHFELVVPERAGICRTLLNAVLAIAARHLSHTKGFDPLASNRYHDECLKYLNPMLNHAATLSDENLFAATIILRMLEEMEGTTTGQDHYGHLLGIHAFVNMGDQYMLPGSLSAASFWAGLRQEIYIAVVTQQPVKVSLDHHVVDRSFTPSDDYTWSNRAVVHLADVLNFCFGDVAHSKTRWSDLNDACEKWSMTRPISFNPFFYRERTPPEAFPEIWHGSSCHVQGIQHHILAQLFLIQFDPSIPKVGTNRRAAMKQMTQRIESLVREICGIGFCNKWSPPAMFTACMGIAMFGDQFAERADQESLIDLLRMTEDGHARPTASIQHQLIKVWGWGNGSGSSPPDQERK